MTTLLCGLLIDGSGAEPKRDQVVRIDENKIVSISDRDGTVYSDSDTLLDFSAFALTPGFVDCHDHLTLDIGDDAAQCAESDAWLTAVAVANARTMLQSGITTLRGCGEKHWIDIDVKRAIERGVVPGPRILASGQPICRTGGHGHTLSREADGEADVRKAVREQLKQGVDLIKIMASGGSSTPGSRPDGQEMTDAEIQAAVDEAHRAQRKVAAHLHGGPAFRPAIAAGVDSVEHGVMLTDNDLRLLVESGAYLVSTAGLATAILGNPNVPQFYREKIQKSMAKRRNLLGAARAYAVKLAVGNDTNHGHIDMEIEALVNAGYTAMEALVIATRNGADLCGVLDQVGTLEPGKLADLIAFSGNPLEDISLFSDPLLVMKDGRVAFDLRNKNT